jgi:hypothetical protein
MREHPIYTAGSLYVRVEEFDKLKAERDALQAEVERVQRDADVAWQLQGEAQARVEQLEQALREYAEHQSWRCQYADKQYYLVHSPPVDDCACGFDKTMRELGLHPDQQGGE